MASIIERLATIDLPFDEDALLSNNPVQLTDYMRELVKTLQEILEDIATIVNFGVDLNDGEALYLGLKNSGGEYPIGTWRKKVADTEDVTADNADSVGDLMVQIKTGTNTWITVRSDRGS